jgi:hypothetical protein
MQAPGLCHQGGHDQALLIPAPVKHSQQLFMVGGGHSVDQEVGGRLSFDSVYQEVYSCFELSGYHGVLPGRQSPTMGVDPHGLRMPTLVY